MASLIKRAPFSPFVTGAALYVLTRAPLDTRQAALQRLGQYLSPQNIGRLVGLLKWLFGIGVARNLNRYLNAWVRNGGRLRPSQKGWVWEKEIAVVTGGSSGFGALFTKGLAAKGINVVVLDINTLPADMQSNPKITFFQCDVTSIESVKDVAKQVQETVGHPSILINNAGIGAITPIMETSPELLHKMFDINLLSHWWLLQTFLPAMIAAKKGHIVSIASVASFISGPGMAHYSATKAGVMALHESLTVELKGVHKCPEIKTTIVHPTFADTPMVAPGKEMLQKKGMRLIDPQIVADAVVKQILSCRQGQIILAGQHGIVAYLRALPSWFLALIQRRQAKWSDEA
ncbi:hypothetical protein M8818_001160 [Zalaria obscura]|uniref:Uncharacterized protein n=1 Tax=Zalaria obscura TaxID=2024903 RepID=A0ACC3SKW0_9PEZI